MDGWTNGRNSTFPAVAAAAATTRKVERNTNRKGNLRRRRRCNMWQLSLVTAAALQFTFDAFVAFVQAAFR